jgi:hypothetical protein
VFVKTNKDFWCDVLSADTAVRNTAGKMMKNVPMYVV